MEKLYRINVSVGNLCSRGWDTDIIVRAYEAEKKAKVIVVNQIREGQVLGKGTRGNAQHLKPTDIDSPWVNANDWSVNAGVWCEEEQIEDYIGLLKEKVIAKLNEVIEFWTAGEKNFVINKDKVEVQYMENR